MICLLFESDDVIPGKHNQLLLNVEVDKGSSSTADACSSFSGDVSHFTILVFAVYRLYSIIDDCV